MMWPQATPSHIILSIFALSALPALIRLVKNGNETQGAHPASQRQLALAEYADPKSTALRGRRVLDQLQPDLDEQAELLADTTFAEQQTDAMNIQQPSQAKVSYVTSFWAERKGVVDHPHRLEIRAALLANILNPHFDQVVIFLDGVSEEANCDHFLDGMRELNRELGEVLAQQIFNIQADPFARVTCVGVPGGQPSYYQMFQNTLHEAVTGDIIVLANADQAFDDTISLARYLNPKLLVALGTRGYTDKISPDTKALYEQLVGRNHPMYLKETPDRCLVTPGSLDTWIFHKRMIMGRLKEVYFQRLNRRKEMEFFYMNEYQAENAAVWALNKCVPEFTSVYNACDRINSWHFHLTSKMHAAHSTSWGRVPQPWSPPFPSKKPKCINEGNCFLKM